MESPATGFALRSTVFSLHSIAKIVPILDASGADSMWFPNVGLGLDTLDVCALSLGKTSRIRVGTGVVRPAEYGYDELLARVHTLSEFSGGRFILGLGTGTSIGRAALDGLAQVARRVRADYADPTRPPIFLAALRRRALSVACENADGAILNFCPPAYVKKITDTLASDSDFSLACYIKLFFAENDETATEMLADEFQNYNRIVQYHAMFDAIGVSDVIDGLTAGSRRAVPESLREISQANPSDSELRELVGCFRSAGVNLPVVYPYVAGSEDYKVEVVRRLASALA